MTFRAWLVLTSVLVGISGCSTVEHHTEVTETRDEVHTTKEVTQPKDVPEKQAPEVAKAEKTIRPTIGEIKKRLANHLKTFSDLAGDAVYIIGDGRAEIKDEDNEYGATTHSDYVAEVITPWRARHDLLRQGIEKTIDMCRECSSSYALEQCADRLSDLTQAQEILWQAVTEAATSNPGEGRKLLKEAKRIGKIQ